MGPPVAAILHIASSRSSATAGGSSATCRRVGAHPGSHCGNDGGGEVFEVDQDRFGVVRRLRRAAKRGRRPAPAPDSPGAVTPMRVRYRDGTLEPVDVTRIGIAVARLRATSPPSTPCGLGPHHRRALRRGHHRGAGPAVDPDRRRAHRRGARVLAARGRLLAAALTDEAAGQGVTSFSGGVAPGHDLGLIGEHTAASSPATPAGSTPCCQPSWRPGAARRFEYFGCARWPKASIRRRDRALGTHTLTRKDSSRGGGARGEDLGTADGGAVRQADSAMMTWRFTHRPQALHGRVPCREAPG